MRVKRPWFFCHLSNAQEAWDIARCQCSSTSPSQNAVNGCYFVLFLEATHPKTYPGPPVFPKFFEASKTDLSKIYAAKRSHLQMVKSHVSWAMVILADNFSNKSCHSGRIRRSEKQELIDENKKTIVIQPPENLFLHGGFNPFEKYHIVKLDHFPRDQSEKLGKNWNHHLGLLLADCKIRTFVKHLKPPPILV